MPPSTILHRAIYAPQKRMKSGLAQADGPLREAQNPHPLGARRIDLVRRAFRPINTSSAALSAAGDASEMALHSGQMLEAAGTASDGDEVSAADHENAAVTGREKTSRAAGGEYAQAPTGIDGKTTVAPAQGHAKDAARLKHEFLGFAPFQGIRPARHEPKRCRAQGDRGHADH